jgi:hypothetical protein
MKQMRYLSLASLLLFFAFGFPQCVSSHSFALQESVAIVKKTVVLIRSKRITREQPHRKKAKVSYPVITGGLSDPNVLRRVRSLLSVKNIFDSSLEDYRQDTWLNEFDYTINYDKNYILDITFRQEGSAAYPDMQEKHLAINLKTGKLITVSDVFNPETLEGLAKIIDNQLQAELKKTIDQVNQDKSIGAEEKAMVPDLYEGLKFEVKDLNDFMIGSDEITFLYEAGFPHVIQAYEPIGKYKNNYAELAPYLKRKDPPASLTQ